MSVFKRRWAVCFISVVGFFNSVLQMKFEQDTLLYARPKVGHKPLLCLIECHLLECGPSSQDSIFNMILYSATSVRFCSTAILI